MTRAEFINSLKLKSNQLDAAASTFEDATRREFMRYSAGKLIEYDLTKFDGRRIMLLREEVDASENFPETRPSYRTRK